jgi:hypothetical protein
MIGFIILLLTFLSLVASCFVWGVHELRHPKDEGPLFVDLSRKIVERMPAFELRKNLLALKAEDKGWIRVKEEDKPIWLKNLMVSSKTWIMNGDVHGDVWLVLGDVTVLKETVFDKVLIVWGSFQTGEKCSFEREIYAAGDCIIGRENHLRSITTHKSIVIGDESVVEGYVDSDDKMYVKRGCKVGELAASQTAVFAAEECSFGSTYSPAGLISMTDAEELINVDRAIQRQLIVCTASTQIYEYAWRETT